ncbi:hypothetical protein [Haladaptatus sp. GCM10025893]|uniref:hypothetical protein n=1 Tax=Haladaptatus sp. GCM10025893 TaxID=3252659 RepID=UPI003620DAF0
MACSTRNWACPHPPKPRQFLPQPASSLDLSPEVRHRAVEYTDHARELGIDNGCNPAGVAAACLELASNHAGEHVLQCELAENADVSTATLRKHRDALEEVL